MDETKICRTCGIEKPVVDFYAKGLRLNGSIRYRADCKDCNKAAIANDPEERERIRQKTADWCAKDPERARKSNRDSRTKHIEKRRAAEHKYRHDPETRPTVLATDKRSRIKHGDKRRAATRAHRKLLDAHYKAYLKAYWQKNPDKAREYSARRRAFKKMSGGSFTADDVSEIRILQKGKCAICRKPLNGDESIDHIVPLVKGGTNDRKNLQLVHKSCNSRKRSKDMIDFMQELGFLL